MKKSSLIKAIQESLSDDLRRPEFRGNPNPLSGHCYVASEAFFHLTPNPRMWKPGSIKLKNCVHWILVHRRTGEIVDITAKQFTNPISYDKFVGRGFLTKQPSKRTKILIKRVKQRLASKK